MKSHYHICCVFPGVVEKVIQKVSDNFVKQPVATQELLYARFLSMKASLCKVNNVGQQRAADCHCQIMLHSLATAFKSLLRPKSMTALDSVSCFCIVLFFYWLYCIVEFIE